MRGNEPIPSKFGPSRAGSRKRIVGLKAAEVATEPRCTGQLRVRQASQVSRRGLRSPVQGASRHHEGR